MNATTPTAVRGAAFSLTADSPAKRADVYEQITERIIALLETGAVPWRKPWNAQTGLPRNLISGHPYRGINVFLLHSMNYESPLWLTYKQALDLGGHVRKGERACPVVFWKQWERENTQTGETKKSRCCGCTTFSMSRSARI